MRYVFIINPTAGKGNGTSMIPEIEKTLEGKNYKIYVTERSAEGTEIARKEAESGEEIRMFACGGEGTGFEVINGIVGFGNVAFGVVPCGSANDFLKSFGNKERFFDIAAQVAGEEKEIDLITVSSIEQQAMMPSDNRFREAVLKERVNIYTAA